MGRGRFSVDDHATEIASIPALLVVLAPEGAVVAVDAKGRRLATARRIVARGGEPASAGQDNQPMPPDPVADLVPVAAGGPAGTAPDHHRAIDKGYG